MFICSNCNAEYTKWQGQCTKCGKWGTLVENATVTKFARKPSKQNCKSKTTYSSNQPVKIKDIVRTENDTFLKTNFTEFDNALGGRLIRGQVLLLAGAPGIGKSTLSLKIIDNLSNQNLNILYIAGEESPEQIKHRSDRLRLKLENVSFYPEYNVSEIEKFIASHAQSINFVVIDSIQTIYSPEITSISGSVSQISESTNRLVGLAKGFGITTIIIGHVTKSGDIAGPKILEHMVDTVLYFEGDKRNDLRILRVEKNRFGPTDEAGIFRMTEKGLVEVKDTKELLSIKKESEIGSVYSMVLEGSRPIVVEVQALATKTFFTNPRRATSGFDLSRLFILLAIIDKQLKLKTYEYDIYVNITGGLNIKDPAIDLAVIKAVVSSIKNQPVDSESIFFGEVGLTGEVRKVPLQDKRVKEAKRIGFSKILDSNFVNGIRSL